MNVEIVEIGYEDGELKELLEISSSKLVKMPLLANASTKNRAILKADKPYFMIIFCL